MIMPISWQYTDVYGVIIHYITEHLDPTNYLLNFGIVALNELRPKVIIRFTLKNIRNNLRHCWTHFWREKPWKICLMVFMNHKGSQIKCLVKLLLGVKITNTYCFRLG